MVVTNLSDNSVTTSTLDEAAGKIAKALAAAFSCAAQTAWINDA